MNGLLDDGALCHVFSFLTLQQRHQVIPLVCKHWKQLLGSPQLLQHVSLRLERPAGGSDERLLALFRWLRRLAAPHIQHLELGMAAEEQSGGALRDPDLLEQLTASLAACGAAGRLTSLRLDVDSILLLIPRELAALRSLRRLRVEAFIMQEDEHGHQSTLFIHGLEAVTGLEQLRLGSNKVSLRGGLPLSLSKLYLDGYLDSYLAPGAPKRCLPHQLTTLAGLRSLGLSRVYSTCADDYFQLSQLTQLERLSLANCTHLPACLPALTMLRVLRLDDTPHGWYGRGDANKELGAALRSLGQLTHLVLRNVDCLGMGLPAEVAGLAQLQRFYWLQQHEEEASNVLPEGPWTLSLRQMALGSITAASNLPVLSAAHWLEALVVVDTLGSDSARSRYERHPAVAAWANQHPTLRVLGICASELPWLAQKMPAWQELRKRVAHLNIRPTLSIESGTALMCQLGFMAEELTDTTF